MERDFSFMNFSAATFLRPFKNSAIYFRPYFFLDYDDLVKAHKLNLFNHLWLRQILFQNCQNI